MVAWGALDAEVLVNAHFACGQQRVVAVLAPAVFSVVTFSAPAAEVGPFNGAVLTKLVETSGIQA